MGTSLVRISLVRIKQVADAHTIDRLTG